MVRRPRPEILSVAERHFAELSRGLFDVTITQDGAEVTPEDLTRFVVVLFTATYQGHPAFGAMFGARYDRRPWRTREHPQAGVRVRVEDRLHPATRHLGESFEIADDIDQFKDFDRGRMRLLLSLDPASLDLESPKVNRRDRDLPVSWAKTHGEGRVFSTALGDWEETRADPRYRTHLIGGIRWALGIEGGE